MGKQLCKLGTRLEKDFESYALLVNRPRFICRECGRAANEKRMLCEPKKIKVKSGKSSGKDSTGAGGP